MKLLQYPKRLLEAIEALAGAACEICELLEDALANGSIIVHVCSDDGGDGEDEGEDNVSN